MVCEAGVYVANKHNYAQLTNIHYWSTAAGAWSPNLIGAATPFELFANPVAVDDVLVFGVDSTVANTRQFCSLVFDIERDFGANIGAVTARWRYSDALADPTGWAILTVLDNTNANGALTGRFADTLGIGSVHWEQEALVAVDPQVGAGAALGVTGYWVAVHITAVAGGTTPPRQQNRDIYSILWPRISIDADEIGGDFPAVPRIILHNQSDAYLISGGVESPELYQSKVIIGARSLNRLGIDCSDFSAYLNMTDEAQNPTGITFSSGSLASNEFSATGRYVQLVGAVPPGGTVGTWTISSAYAAQYYGRFHAYVLGTQLNGSAGDITVAVRTRHFEAGFSYTDTEYVPFIQPSGPRHGIIDIGEVTLGAPINLLATEEADLTISVQYKILTGASINAEFYTLVLIPVDEWAAEYMIAGDQSTSYFSSLALRGDATASGGEERRYLMIDAYGIPKVIVRAPLVRGTTGEYISMWDAFGTAPKIDANVAQDLWFLTARVSAGAVPSELNLDGRPEAAMTVELLVQQRYSSARGNT